MVWDMKAAPERLELTAFRMPVPFLQKMRELKRDRYISISQQVRTALYDYLKKMKKIP